MKDLHCLTCEYAQEYGYDTLICIHPNLAKKHQNKTMHTHAKGHPSHCPIIKSLEKELSKMWNNHG